MKEGKMKYAIYAICCTFFALAIVGAYYTGMAIGKRDVQIKYITQEKEVIKYVEKEKSKIYSSPSAAPSDLIRLFNDGKL